MMQFVLSRTMLFTISVVVAISLYSCSQTQDPIQSESESVSTSTGKGNAMQGKPIPTVTTSTATNIGVFAAQCGGNATNGSSITSRGVCYGTTANPTLANTVITSGSGTGSFSCTLPGLTPNTTYYVRAFATNSSGTGFGGQTTFTTTSTNPSPDTFTDYDGNVYNTITYGSQTWAVENLKTTHYRNGDSIAQVTDNSTWGALTTGALCNYNNSTSTAATYGRLYNWYAVTDSRCVAPTGWHVATYDEWQTLIDYLGGSNYGGAAAKEAGQSHWNTPNTQATNSASFTAVPSGARYVNGAGLTPVVFSGVGSYSPWWTSSASGASGRFVEADRNSTRMYRSSFIGGVGYYDKRTGYAVRLIKD